MKRTLNYGFFAVLMLVLVFGFSGEANATFTVTNTGPSVIDTVPPNNNVSVGVTTTVSPTTISWGIRSGSGASYGGGSITIAAGQGVGFGSATISAPAGTYTIFATSSAEGAASAAGGTITVQAPVTPTIPTNPPTIVTINSGPITPPVYSKFRNFNVSGTADASTTLEVQINGVRQGTALVTVGGQWSFAASVLADGAVTVQAINARGGSNSVNLTVDQTKPQIAITYNPGATSQPYSVGNVNITAVVTDAGSANLASLVLTVITPNGTPALLTLMPATGTATSFTGTITIAQTATAVNIAGIPSTDGVCTMFAQITDPAGNTSTDVTSGGSFSVNTGGPSSAGASVIVENSLVYSNNQLVNFTWKGFTHSNGIAKITKYWAIAVTPPATPPTTTNSWTDMGAGTLPANGAGSGSLRVNTDGTWEIHVMAQDATPDFSTSVNDGIIVDSRGPAVDPASTVPTGSNGTEQTEITCTLTEAISGLKYESVVMSVNGTQYSPNLPGVSNPSPAMSVTPAGVGVYRITFKPQLIGLKFAKNSTVNVVVGSATSDMAGNRLGGSGGAPGADYSWSFTVNTNANAPGVGEALPTAGGYYKTKRPPITLHLDDADGIDPTSVLMTISNGNNYMSFNVGPNLTLNHAAGSTDNVLLLTPPTDLAEGTVTVSLQTAKDTVGNPMSQYSWTFYVDNTPPVPSNPYPAPGTTTSTTNPIINIKLDDAGSGVDYSPTGISVIVTFTPISNPAATWERTLAVDDANNPGLTYNPSTKILSFNPSLDPAHPMGIGSVEVRIATALDKAVTPTVPPAPAPNALIPPYTWSFAISNMAGPVVSFNDSVPLPPDQATGAYRYSNLEPLIIRTVLIDEDLIDHSSLLLDLNGRTFRNGDAQISWTTTNTASVAGTHEIIVLDLSNDSALVKQGTNELRLRAASDRTGKPLQIPAGQSYVNISFLYDTEGPKASNQNPQTTIYDLVNGQVKCSLTDNFAGIDRVYLNVTDNETGASTLYTTDTNPANLVYDKTVGELIFRSSTPYKQGKSYTFSVNPPNSPANPDGSVNKNGTVDKAGNGIGKAIGSSATAAFSWTLTAASTTDVVLLSTPANDTFVNVTKSTFAFTWKPLTGASMYRIQISDNLSFIDDGSTNRIYSYDVAATSFTHETLQNELLKHGMKYYWQVSAVSGQAYGTSERRQFTVDNLAPQTPKIVGVIDYQNLNPQHVNTTPLASTTHVKTRSVRVRVLLYEGAPSTVGYSISVGYVKNTDGQTLKYTELGKMSEVHGYDTNEVDITLPNDDGDYRIVAYVVDRASNFSNPSEEARIYLNRKIPKINNITLTDPSPNANGYITSGKIKFEVTFNTPIDMLPLTDYVIKPSIKFDPKSAEGTSAIEITDLTVVGKTASGMGYIPYGRGEEFDGLADIIVTGFLDASWNTMEGGAVTYYKYFEIDTAPGFGVRTFLNPIDEKNVLINMQASETLLIPPSCFIIVSNGNNNQLPVNIMAKNLYATSTTGTIGENNIRVSGIDTRNNIGYWPTPDILKESKFLMVEYKSSKNNFIESKDMGVSVNIPQRAMADGKMYVFPYKLEYIGNNILGRTAAASNLSPKAAPARMAALESVSKDVKADIKIKALGNKVMMVSRSEGSSGAVDVKIAPDSEKDKTAAELTQKSLLYDVSPVRNLKVEGSIAIDYEAEKMSKNTGLYYSADGILWDFVGGTYADKKFTTPIKATGIYGVFEDTKAPVVTRSYPDKTTKITTARPELCAFISEFGSGIDPNTAMVKIDGVAYKGEYNERESKITYVPSDNMTAGAHSVVFEMSDRAGNVSRQVNNVVVPNLDPKITNAVSYPNPVRSGNATISFAVDGTLNNAIDAAVYIYDVNANPVTELSVMPELGSTSKFRATWLGLANDDGKTVANGIYFYKIKVNCADKKIEKFGKIAVLK